MGRRALSKQIKAPGLAETAARKGFSHYGTSIDIMQTQAIEVEGDDDVVVREKL